MTQIIYLSKKSLGLTANLFTAQLFVRACTAAFSAHSTFLYDDNKYANKTMICTSLPLKPCQDKKEQMLF